MPAILLLVGLILLVGHVQGFFSAAVAGTCRSGSSTSSTDVPAPWAALATAAVAPVPARHTGERRNFLQTALDCAAAASATEGGSGNARYVQA